MKLEAVGGISMSNVGFKVCWQVNDIDSPKRTFFWTNTTANTEALGDECDFRFGSYFDTEFSGANNRTRLLTLLSTFLYTRRSVYTSLVRGILQKRIPLACTEPNLRC